VADVEAHQRLRSSSSSSLIVSRTRLSTVGDRAFPVATARVWNSLPEHVTSAPSVAVFRSRLKSSSVPHLVSHYPLVTAVQFPRSDAHVTLDTLIGFVTYLLTYLRFSDTRDH